MTSLFDDSLRKIQFLFKYSGMHLELKSSKTIADIIRYRWLYIINFLWLNTDVIGEIFWIIDGAANGKKLSELTYIAPCTTLCMLANLKSIFLILSEDALTQLTKNLREMERSEDGSENMVKDTIIEEQRSFLNVVISALNFWNAMTVIAFSLTPLVLMAVEFRKTNEVELMLPFLIVYPFDSYDIKYWPFVYLHQAIDDVAFVLSFLTFLLMSLLQIFLLCFFGDMIMTSVSLEILSTAWSYFALLKTIEKD
ncbi:hypothetical protein MSG28_012790 [Choristoneura fumiferana]|uniref:Uncharacterized protein n=1 Tax=Choristoneura fumiferana TaxID=7141 RepID=A0ACC0JI42_CHOFU|nr:hypothetical protein MSG28_012790 [Choristoneura fumiferana]